MRQSGGMSEHDEQRDRHDVGGAQAPDLTRLVGQLLAGGEHDQEQGDALVVVAGHDLDWHAYLDHPTRGRLGYVVGGADVDFDPVAATGELAAHGWAVVGGSQGWRETGPEERWQWVAAVRACAPAARPAVVGEDAAGSIADDLARYLPAQNGERRVVHVDTGDGQEHDHGQEHGDVAVDGGADPLGWSIVPAGLAGALREVVERHLPPGRAAEAGVATDALVWDLTVAAESWQGGTAPYRPGVVL